MLDYSQEFNDAIRSTNRQIVGRITFNGDISKTILGSTGLISFDVHQDAMDEERFCIGSTVAAYCNASFYNDGIPAGVDLTNSYFDAYIGVTYDENDGYPYGQNILENYSAVITTRDGVEISNSAWLMPFAFENDTYVTITVNNTKMAGVVRTARITPTKWSRTVEVTDGTLTYRLENNFGSVSTPVNFIAVDSNDDTVPGTYVLTVTGAYAEYKCMGRFYVQSIDQGKFTTSITGYDAISKLNVKYTPNLTLDPDMTSYWAYQVLNDIIDQTGVNNGTHFENTDPTWTTSYVQAVNDGTCREQWEWLEQTNMTKKGCVCRASRTNLGFIEEVQFSDGWNNYANYPAIDNTVVYENSYESKGELFTIKYMTAGTSDDKVTYGDATKQGVAFFNPYFIHNNFEWSDTGKARGQLIFESIENISFTPMKFRFRGDPCIEVMDSLKVTQDGNNYRCVVMRLDTTFNGGLEQTIECWGQKDEYYEMSNGAISQKVDAIADFVVDTKIYSPWNVRKWNSGYVELWCRKSFPGLSFSQVGNGIYAADIPRIAYPFDLVRAESIVETVTPASAPSVSTNKAYWIQTKAGDTAPTRTHTGQYQAVKTTGTSETIYVNYKVAARMVGTLSS